MNKTRWGLIGCGDVAEKRVAQAIQSEPRSQLVAACRRDETKLRDFCEKFSVKQPFTDYKRLISEANVDAVYIATPVCEHLPQALAAAEAGRHVLVEKPMAMTVAECDAMIAGCRESNVKLAVAYYRRFYPLIDRVQQLLQEGEIGSPIAVSAVTTVPLDMKTDEEGYWRVVAKAGGGGALMDVGSHRINVFLYLFGEIDEVKATCNTPLASYEAESNALVLMRFANGVVGSLQCHFGTTVDPDEFSILGTKGRLVARPLNGTELIVESNSQRRVEQHPPAQNLSSPLIADFVSAILDNRPPRVTGEEGRATNEVMQGAYANAQSAGA